MNNNNSGLVNSVKVLLHQYLWPLVVWVIDKMASSFGARTSATNPQFSSTSTPAGYNAGGMPDARNGTFGASASGSGHGLTTPTSAGHSQGYGQTYDAGGYHAPPTVSVTDYGSSSYYPYNEPGPENRGYEDDYSPPPDFDALFSGESRPSVVVSGMEGTAVPCTKASHVLGLGDPHNLVYENSGFSRNVHFDPSSLPGNGVDAQAEVYAKKRRESIAAVPKKSKSLFVSKTKSNKNDRWLEWSENMRVEAQIKKEEFVKKQEEAAKNKLPAPIRKARQESVKFVNPGATSTEEETPLSRALHAMEKAVPGAGESAVLTKEQIRDRYTEDQWERLHAYWGHSLFRKSRPIGYLVSFVAMVAAIPPILSTRWVKYHMDRDVNITFAIDEEMNYDSESLNCTNYNVNGTCYITGREFSHIEHHGFWFNCTDNISSYSGIGDGACAPITRTPENDRWLGIWECCYGSLLQGKLTAQQIDSGLCLITVNNMDKLPRWQSAILGLLLFSLAAGLFASFLTTWGVCATSLARKVYFYHSAGEIFLVCGICSMAAMITYPAVLESSKATPPRHEYGMGYFLGWGMPLFYFISAFCMTLDDMIHSITNDCCLICRKKTTHKSSLSTAPI